MEFIINLFVWTLGIFALGIFAGFAIYDRIDDKMNEEIKRNEKILDDLQ